MCHVVNSNVDLNLGESTNPDGAVGLLEYRDTDSGEVPTMLFFKHGLEEEKV